VIPTSWKIKFDIKINNNNFKQRQPIFVGFVCDVHQEDNVECIHQLLGCVQKRYVTTCVDSLLQL